MNILKQPIKVGNLTLNSRLVMPPMETGKGINDRVSPAVCEYYDRKTRGGHLGLVITEHCYISPEGRASKNQLSIASDDCIDGLKKIADIVHNNSVPVILQLAHAGSKTTNSITGETISASSVLMDQINGRETGKPVPKEMTQEDIERIIQCFADAAIRAKKAGFDGVEIHGAHGYLLNQFYSPLTNHRTDAYTGKTLEGRLLLFSRIIQAIRKVTGEAFVISVRLGASDYQRGGATMEEAPEAAKALEAAGADLMNVSGGMCIFSRPGHTEQGWFAELSECIKKVVSVPVMVTGGIKEKEAAQQLLLEKKADLIGVGRALLKDSDLPEKFMKEE